MLFFFKIYLRILCLCMCLRVCMCTRCMSGILKGRRAWDPGIEVTRAGNRTRSSTRTAELLSSTLILLFKTRTLTTNKSFP